MLNSGNAYIIQFDNCYDLFNFSKHGRLIFSTSKQSRYTPWRRLRGEEV
jgi:hypothetical protein